MRPRLPVSGPGLGSLGRQETAGWLTLALPLLLLQTALSFYLATGWVGLGGFLVAHLALCGGAGLAGCAWAMAGPRDARAGRIAMIGSMVAWTVLAGPFGTLAAAAFRAAPRAGAGVAPAAPSSVLERLERLEAALLDHRLRLDGADAVRPLLDVMRDGTQAEKLDALSLMAKRYEADAAPALRRGLADPDGAVRVLAATVMAQRTSACTRRIGECSARVRARPEAAERWWELAEAHVAYAESGLLETARAEAELAQAEQCRIHAGLAAEPQGAAA